MKGFFKRLLKWTAAAFGFLVLLAAGGLAFLHYYRPAVPVVILPPYKPVSGAAVFYTQAAAAMPELSEEEKKLLNTKRGEPLDTEAAKQLVTKCEEPLRLLAQGAAQTGCEWGLDYSEGPAMEMPAIVKTLDFCKLLKMRAPLHLLNGEVSAATDDLLLIFRVARHVEQTPLVIPKLVGISENVNAMDTLLRHLQEFDLASLQRIEGGIASLPPSPSMRDAVGMDTKTFTAYLCKLVAERHASTKQQTGCILSSLQADTTAPPLIQVIDAIPALHFISLRRLERNSQELQKLMEVPYPEGRAKIDAFGEKFDRKNVGLLMAFLDIWSGLVLRADAVCRHKEVQLEAMWTILHTAINTQLHNPVELREQLAKLRDPYDGGPITMRDVEGGVELQLKAGENKKPVTLTVQLPRK